MEDYIFIIIAIVLSIFGAMNRNKKKQAVNDQSSESGSSVFEQLFADNFLDSPLQEPQPVAEKPVKSKLKYEALSKKEIKKTEPVKPIQRTMKKAEKAEVKSTSIRNSIRKDFSLKKAVIYSEILQRKY